MMKTSTSFGFSSSLLFFIVASIAVYSEAQPLTYCPYIFTIKTGSVSEAGTDSVIGVTFSNSEGQTIHVYDLKPSGVMPADHEYFKRGNTDTFVVQATCSTKPVCKITMTSDGGGEKKPKWYVESVTVDLLFPGTEIKFEFNQWLAPDAPYELTASRDVCKSSTTNKSINDV